MLAFLDAKLNLDLPVSWIIGGIAFAGTLVTTTVKVILKKNSNKFVYKDVCKKQHEVEKVQHRAVHDQLKSLDGKVDQVLSALLNKK